MSVICEPGELERLAKREPAIFEALCLIEGLRRIGVRDSRAAGLTDLATRTTVEYDARRDYTVRALADKLAGSGDKALLPAGLESGSRCLFVRVSTEELGQVWTGLVGPLPYEEEEFTRRWAAAVEIFGKAPSFEAEPLWEASAARSRLPDLQNLLWRKGFISGLT